MSEKVTYEHPMNERVRLLLRLEHLFDLIGTSMTCGNECADRTILDAMAAILQITGRNNVKQELLRCIERQHEKFDAMSSSEDVDHAALADVTRALDELAEQLHDDSSAIGNEIQAHPLLEGVRRRTLQPGGTSPVDMPELHMWLSQPADTRHKEIARWRDSLALCEEGVARVLEFSRLSCELHQVRAENGFFHANVSERPSIQLVRVTVRLDEAGYPEISGNPHRITVRWVSPPDSGARPRQMREVIDFELGYCYL